MFFGESDNLATPQDGETLASLLPNVFHNELVSFSWNFSSSFRLAYTRDVGLAFSLSNSISIEKNIYSQIVIANLSNKYVQYSNVFKRPFANNGDK